MRTMRSHLVVFGASGDLTARLLAPGLAALAAAGELPDRFALAGVGVEAWSDGDFRDHLGDALVRHAPDVGDDARARVRDAATFRSADVTDAGQVAAVVDDEPFVAYLALPPHLFAPTLEALADAGVPDGSVIAIEKPFGQDLDSARHLNALLASRFGDITVFRNDHFLHSQTVQNVLGLRFANRVFEPVWRAPHVVAAAITWDETLALEGRAGYYDRAGALRDMLQNHLMQVLCLTAMEPPSSVGAADLHLAKQRALRAVGTPDRSSLADRTIRARYTAGRVGDRAVRDYVAEDGVDPSRDTETFAQVTLELDDWRWAGVPFTLRSGKAMATDAAMVAITFADVPHRAFTAADGQANRLVVDLRHPGTSLDLNVNADGDRFALAPARLSAALPTAALPPYAELLRDVLAGDTTLSVSGVEAEEAWRIVQPILDGWADDVVPLRTYAAGQPLDEGWRTDR